AAQTKTAQATGHGQTPGVQARGTITFRHAVGIWQTILKGTVFNVRGLQVVTDEPVSLPPADVDNPTSASGAAHVVQAGSAGNLPAGAINQLCCSTDLSIRAISGPFTGGQDPQSYTFVQQSDIDSVANPLKASLTQEAQQEFQRQLRPGEQLISQPTCSTSVKSDHQAGDHASSVTVTVSASCSGEAFDKQAALRLGASLLSQEASKTLGSDYAPAGQIMTSISGATPINSGPEKGSISITVTAEGLWAYQFDGAHKESLARLIAGKTRSEALQLLQRQSGIKEADIAIAHGSDRLPNDANQITITINSVSGLTPVPSASSGPGSPPTTAPTTPGPGTPATTGKG
ncbi:MAG: baseplate J/gp47 family protein, partial [Thermogemmatispora sp.]|uniref:baseplate J/gp47 family protein n=1 Tax=Thermogemmatispora sp. TaxID=1968838 RepID=UPI001D6A0E4E